MIDLSTSSFQYFLLIIQFTSPQMTVPLTPKEFFHLNFIVHLEAQGVYLATNWNVTKYKFLTFGHFYFEFCLNNNQGLKNFAVLFPASPSFFKGLTKLTFILFSVAESLLILLLENYQSMGSIRTTYYLLNSPMNVAESLTEEIAQIKKGTVKFNCLF